MSPVSEHADPNPASLPASDSQGGEVAAPASLPAASLPAPGPRPTRQLQGHGSQGMPTSSAIPPA